MGSTPFEGGVTFRVWAPDATAVSVSVGAGRGAASVASLAAEGIGRWSADVDSVSVGQQYQYVLTTPGGQLTRVDPYARNVLDTGPMQDASAALVYNEQTFDWGQAAWNSPGWSELVVYELHVGSFNKQPDEPVGRFDDVVAKLPYLQSLGINAIELLPVAAFQGDVSWGYDPGVPFAVAPGYGGPDGLKRLIRAAHEAGMAVILDVVYNHFGPPDSILWQFDGEGPGWEGGIYFYGTRYPGDPRPQTPWGSRPDYGRPEVREYLRDNAMSWLQDYRIDGLRFDATAYIRSADGSGSSGEAIPDGSLLLREINSDIAAAQPWKLTVAEDMRGDASITVPQAAGGTGFDSQWDGEFLSAVRQTVEVTMDNQRDMNLIADQLERRFGAAATTRVIFTESHDADGNGRRRVPTEIDPAQPDSWWSKKRSTLAGALVLTAPGIPMLFQGQEFLDQKPFIQNPPPLEWADANTYAGILQLYRDLIQLRRDWHDTTRGLRGNGLNVFHINNTDKLIAYHRWSHGGPRDDVVVALNFANRGYNSYTMGFPRQGRWRVRFNSDWSGYDRSFGDWLGYDTNTDQGARDGLPAAGNIGIGPYTALILSQDA